LYHIGNFVSLYKIFPPIGRRSAGARPHDFRKDVIFISGTCSPIERVSVISQRISLRQMFATGPCFMIRSLKYYQKSDFPLAKQGFFL
jgi:hypothetical protein